ncbi:hypothetical protein U9M48_017529 [Paspalum notatum var. saurae]|uniref:Uncharacterized protein n=1 Tax=Paspalum notatum var. saurae TaxID=547442 RepID=A0AAQ3WNX7_PASNO
MIYRNWSLLSSTVVIWGGVAAAGLAGIFLFGGTVQPESPVSSPRRGRYRYPGCALIRTGGVKRGVDPIDGSWIAVPRPSRAVELSSAACGGQIPRFSLGPSRTSISGRCYTAMSFWALIHALLKKFGILDAQPNVIADVVLDL